MRVLLASHTAPGGVFTVGSHHLARELAARGHEVCHLSTPVSLSHLARWRDPEVRRRFGLAVRRGRCADALAFVPFTLVPMALGPRLLSRRALLTAVPRLRSDLRRIGFDRVDVLLVDQPLLAGIEQVVTARTYVYRSTDLVESPAKLAGERAAAAGSDALVATSPLVLRHLQDLRPHVPSLLLENGVEHGRFAARVGGADRRGAVYAGAVDERFDWEVLAAMARGNPDTRITVHSQPAAAPVGLPGNVDLAGPVSYAELPSVFRRARVGLLPLTASDANLGRSPMKLHEYLAAGLNVVTTVAAPPGTPVAPGTWTVDRSRADGAELALREAVASPENVAGSTWALGLDWSDRARLLDEFLCQLLADVTARSGPAMVDLRADPRADPSVAQGWAKSGADGTSKASSSG